MKRTTVRLPVRVRFKAECEARRLGVSLDKYIRGAVENRICGGANGRHRDPLFNDTVTFTDDLPPDVSANLDKYLGQIMDGEVERWHER